MANEEKELIPFSKLDDVLNTPCSEDLVSIIDSQMKKYRENLHPFIQDIPASKDNIQIFNILSRAILEFDTYKYLPNYTINFIRKMINIKEVDKKVSINTILRYIVVWYNKPGIFKTEDIDDKIIDHTDEYSPPQFYDSSIKEPPRQVSTRLSERLQTLKNMKGGQRTKTRCRKR